MNKIIKQEDIGALVTKLKKSRKSIVLGGGCFDILHPGHIKFLEEAKKTGDVLLILLESDQNVKWRKGKNRPINNQKNRSIVLSTLASVDFIIPLTEMTKDEEYDKLIVQIKPDVISITYGDPNIAKRQSQAKMVGANLAVIDRIKTKQTSELIKSI